MNPGSNMRRWLLLLVLIGGSVATVVAAAAWAGTPVKQLPLLIVSLLVGAFLPPAMSIVWARRGQAVTPRSVPQPPTPEGEVYVFSWKGPDKGGCLALLLPLLAIGFICSGIGFQVSPSFRDEWSNLPAETPTATEMLPLTMLFLALGAGALAVVVPTLSDRRQLRIDSVGFTVAVNRSETRVLWEKVSAVGYRHGVLYVDSPALSKLEASRMNAAAAFRLAQTPGIGMLPVMWTPSCPRAAICDVARLTVPSAALFETIEWFWDGEITRDDA